MQEALRPYLDREDISGDSIEPRPEQTGVRLTERRFKGLLEERINSQGEIVLRPRRKIFKVDSF